MLITRVWASWIPALLSTLLHMTIDRTKAGKAKWTEEMERTRHRINLESRDLLILVIILESPQEWRTSAWDVENMNTNQGKGVPQRMPSAKDCHKIEHFHKVCQSKKRATQQANLVQAPQDNDDTHIDENGVRQPNPPPRVDMLKVVNHIEANRENFNEGKHLKFPIVIHLKGPYNHHIMVRVDTCADVNCMNEKTFNELFPEVQLSVCPHEIQNFGNSIADISILGQFCTYLQFRGEKYLNTFVVTDANDCPNLFSHGATFRMGVLLPNYPKDMVVEGENVPHFSKMSGDKMRAPNGPSNVFQILGDIQKWQQAVHSQCENPELASPFRTTTPFKNTAPMTAMSKQANPVHAHTFSVQNTSWSGSPAPGAHVHKPPQQVLKPRDLVALRKVQHPHMAGLLWTDSHWLSKRFCHTTPVALKVLDNFQGNHTNFTWNLSISLQDMLQGKFQSTLMQL